MSDNERTIESLEAEYIGLLRERNRQTTVQLVGGSKLQLDDGGRTSTSLTGNRKTIDLQEIQEAFKDRHGIELTGNSYENIIKNIRRYAGTMKA